MNIMYFRRTGRLTGFVAFALLCLAVTASPTWAGERLLNGKGVLWKVERDGVEPSWVFGTMHVSDERVTALPKPLVEVLTKVDSLSLELIFHDRMNDGDDDGRTLGDGRRLKDIIGPRMFAKIVARLGGGRHVAAEINRLKPWAVALNLGPASREPMRRAQGMVFLDHLLQYIAAERGARVFALETFAEQMQVFDGIPMRQQVAMLRHALRESGGGKKATETMIKNYLARDVQTIHETSIGRLRRRDPEFARVYTERLLDVRNRLMVARMMPRLGEGNALVAVGALHLPGRHGILNLLAQEGYHIARVY